MNESLGVLTRMTHTTANKLGIGGVATGAIALIAGGYGGTLPYRISPMEARLLEVAGFLALVCIPLSLTLGIAAQWGTLRSRRFGYTAIALGLAALVACFLTNGAHAPSRTVP